MKVFAQRTLASLTMATTILSLSGVAFAVAPADYGLTEGNVIRATGDPDIYIVNEHGYKRLFTSPAIFNVYGHIGWASVKEVSAATRDAFGTSGLFRNCESGDQKVYGLEVASEDAGVLHWVNVSGADAVSQDANFFKKVFCINNAEMALYTMGSAYTALSQVPDYSRGGSTPTPSGDLEGTAGDIVSADFVSTLNNEEVGEGESNVKVVGYEVEADDSSDIRLLSARVSFENQDAETGSDDLDDYADSVSFWLGSSKIGDVDVADFDEDSGARWSRTVSFTGNPVIRMGATGNLYVAVSANDVIDGTDLGSNEWYVTIETLRFVDAQGAILTYTAADLDEDDAGSDEGRAFTFESYGTAADLELNLEESDANPEDQLVEVASESDTDGVVLLVGTLSAEGGDITLKQLSVDVTSVGDDIDDIANAFVLEIDGEEVETKDSDACTTPTCDTSEEYVFDDFDEVTIDEGDEVEVRVLANINATEDATEGASLTASINNDGGTDAEDQNGDALASGDKTGSVSGNEQEFRSYGIMLAFVSASESVTDDGAGVDTGTFVIKFKVTAFGEDVILASGSDDAAVEGVQYTDNSGAVIAFTSQTLTSTADESTLGNFEVDEGTTEEFTLTAVVVGNDTFVQAGLVSVDWGLVDGVANVAYDFNLDDFETDPVFLNQ